MPIGMRCGPTCNGVARPCEPERSLEIPGAELVPDDLTPARGPLGRGVQTFVFDAAGNPASETSGGIATTVKVHDEASRLVSTTFDPGGLDRVTDVRL